MENRVTSIPKGYHSLTPYLIVRDAGKAIDFYKKAFGAKEIYRMDAPGEKVSHCELEIGDSKLMLADEFPSIGAIAPGEEVSKSFSLLLYVENVDEFFDRAINSGAKVIRNLKDEFYGDRMGTIQDPFGHNWNVATHLEDVSPEEMRKRSDKLRQ